MYDEVPPPSSITQAYGTARTPSGMNSSCERKELRNSGFRDLHDRAFAAATRAVCAFDRESHTSGFGESLVDATIALSGAFLHQH